MVVPCVGYLMDCCLLVVGDGWDGHGVGVELRMDAVVKHLKQSA